jgi:hypothetical protein
LSSNRRPNPVAGFRGSVQKLRAVASQVHF